MRHSLHLWQTTLVVNVWNVFQFFQTIGNLMLCFQKEYFVNSKYHLHIFIDFKNQNCNFISGFTKSVSLRHQFMETQAFHELMQDSTMYETHSTTSSDAGSPFPSGQYFYLTKKVNTCIISSCLFTCFYLQELCHQLIIQKMKCHQ